MNEGRVLDWAVVMEVLYTLEGDELSGWLSFGLFGARKGTTKSCNSRLSLRVGIPWATGGEGVSTRKLDCPWLSPFPELSKRVPALALRMDARLSRNEARRWLT